MKINYSLSFISGFLLAFSSCVEVYQVSQVQTLRSVDHQNVLNHFLAAVRSGRNKACITFEHPSGGETDCKYSDKKGVESVYITSVPYQRASDSLRFSCLGFTYIFGSPASLTCGI